MWNLMPESYMKLQVTKLAVEFEIQIVRFFSSIVPQKVALELWQHLLQV